jgi:hypothetical protein
MAQDSVRVRAPVQGLEPGRVPARVPARAPGLAPATESLTEQSGRVRRFHKLTLRRPHSPEIPLIAKSVERCTKCSP